MICWSICPRPSKNGAICFRDWTQSVDAYDSAELKRWYSYTVNAIGNQDILFRLWKDENPDQLNSFIDSFIQSFNAMANRTDADALPNRAL